MADVRADGLLREVEAYAIRKLERCAELFVDQVTINAPKRTRELVESIEESVPVVTADDVRITVKVTAEHGVYQNEGTGIYGPEGVPIRPLTPGGVLVFDWPAAGGIVFARSVRGTEPTRFWDKAVERWPEIVRRVTEGG